MEILLKTTVLTMLGVKLDSAERHYRLPGEGKTMFQKKIMKTLQKFCHTVVSISSLKQSVPGMAWSHVKGMAEGLVTLSPRIQWLRQDSEIQ